ncbi:unnamed protein product [Eruca vesicaria subsp. sativa]|uniref:Uncharacterized protein n=1 Tax=Eruca vesicaria subsp. sativa TaxID=29727 RepID=A0ABC8KQE7_ERUVS|nr:unnamed protein product [Eruca vesicaria subsp. sativa]
MFCLVPRPFMFIIKELISNGHAWKESFFFLRINGTSVQENCISMFRSEWNFKHDNNHVPPLSGDLVANKDLHRNGSFYWTSFTPNRFWKALKLHRSQGHSQSFVEVETYSDMDEPASHIVPIQRKRDRSLKNKGNALDDIDSFRMILHCPNSVLVLFRAMGVEPARSLSREAALTISLPTFLRDLILF